MHEQAAPVSHQLTGYLLVPWFQLHKMCNPFGIPPEQEGGHTTMLDKLKLHKITTSIVQIMNNV
jgi:hypothetical protein